MELTFKILITVFTFSCVLSFFYYVWFSLNDPQEYLRQKYKEKDIHSNKFKTPFSKYLAMIGFFLMVYFGIKEGALSLLPNEWGSLDEYGEFASLKSGLALLLTPLSIFCLDGFDKAVIASAREFELKDEEELWKKYKEPYAEHLIKESNSKWNIINAVENKKVILQRLDKKSKEQTIEANNT